jgi:hypothetical protein
MSPSSIFWTFTIKFAAPYDASATPMRYDRICRCVIFIGCAIITTSGRALSGTSARPIFRRHYASRGWRPWHCSRKSATAHHPPVGPWKNHKLRGLRYLVNKDLDNIEWWYWLDDVNDFPLLPVQNPDLCIWAAGCRCYGSDTKDIIHYCSAECRIRH